MDTPGQKLKRVREHLKLRYRDVEHASQQIARRLGNPEFAIALSRLSDIENKGTVPTIYRLYSLCCIYRLGITEVLEWFGIRTTDLVGDILQIPLDATHIMRFSPQPRALEGPVAKGADDPDPAFTRFLGKTAQWGRLSSSLLSGFDFKHLRLGFIGEQDWFMFPLLRPGSVVFIDERERKIAASGWVGEHDRPIYFLEHRGGYSCGWASMHGEFLVLQPHPSSPCAPAIHRFPIEVEVIGRVTGTASLFTPNSQPQDRDGSVRPMSPGR